MIGVIDSGIDFNHAAFRKADGTTRIKKVIDFSKKNVKRVYDTEEAIMALTADDSSDSHGTHVAAIAGGSDLNNGQQEPTMKVVKLHHRTLLLQASVQTYNRWNALHREVGE